MGRVGFTIAVAVMVALCASAERARGQCEYGWIKDLSQGNPGPGGSAPSCTSWDPDGNGPQPELLVVAGKIPYAGHLPASNVIAWDGTRWNPLGLGLSIIPPSIGIDVSCVGVYQGDLIAGGNFNRTGSTSISGLARWDGTQWNDMFSGLGSAVFAILPHGNDLFVGGPLVAPAGLPNSLVARWDGNQWHSVGAGANSPVGGYVGCLTIHDNLLTFGGRFSLAGSSVGYRIARWTGTDWEQLGGVFNGEVKSITSHNGELFCGGFFTTINGVSIRGIARWNGTSWVALSPSLGNVTGVSYLTTFDGKLLVSGAISQSASGSTVALWDGVSWQFVGDQLGGNTTQTTVWRSQLAAVGFSGWGAAIWNGNAWTPACSGLDGPVRAFASINDEFVAVGGFLWAGHQRVDGIARWRNGEWHPLTNSLNQYPVRNAITVFDNQIVAAGTTSVLADGAYRNIATWDDTQWRSLGSGIDPNGYVNCLATFQGELIAGGSFTTAGGLPARNVARWDGQTWRSVGTGINGTSAFVASLAVVDNALIAGGSFTNAGGYDAINIARWNGAAWSPLGTGANGRINAVGQFRNDVIAGGTFSSIGGVNVNNIARWDGAQWHPLGLGVNGFVYSVAEFDDRLFVGGRFTSAGGVTVSNVASWDGVAWHPEGSGGGASPGASSDVYTFFKHGNCLLIGGAFSVIDGSPGAFWSRYCPIDPLPLVHAQPVSPSVCAGSAVSLRTVATGDGALSYHWRKSGIELVDSGEMMGTNTDTLVFVHASVADAGEYDCVVKLNDCTQATSNIATLTVFPTNTADGNGDAVVDGRDVQGMVDALVGFSPVSAGLCAYELNGDGIVSEADVEAFVGRVLGG